MLFLGNPTYFFILHAVVESFNHPPQIGVVEGKLRNLNVAFHVTVNFEGHKKAKCFKQIGQFTKNIFAIPQYKIAP